MCGEQWLTAESCIRLGGSPPRVRGTAKEQARGQSLYRITPACAGNSIYHKPREKRRQDHPRVCGEQASFQRECKPLRGSPPRVRGTGLIEVFAALLDRITPACAGNSGPAIARVRIQKDHPRVCGEQAVQEYQIRELCGSPPRVRGTGISFECESVGDRITPACAGNSMRTFPIKFPRKDHPRVCGEQGLMEIHGKERKGSPPRVRGTAYPLRISSTSPRITPACAGNSSSPPCP